MRPSPTEEGGIGTYRIASRDSVQVTTHRAVSRTPVPGSPPIAVYNESPFKFPGVALGLLGSGTAEGRREERDHHGGTKSTKPEKQRRWYRFCFSRIARIQSVKSV